MAARIPKKMLVHAIHTINDLYSAHPHITTLPSDIVCQRLVNTKVCEQPDVVTLTDRLEQKGYIVFNSDETGWYITRTDECRFYDEDVEETKSKDRFSRAMSIIATFLAGVSLLWQIISHFVPQA